MKTLAAPILDRTPRQALDILEEQTGLSENELAQALGTSRRTLQRWRAGTAYPQVAARQCLGELLLLAEQVRETFESEDAARLWFQSASRYLGGMSPAEAVRVGRVEKAEEALEALRSGIYL